MSQSTFTLKPLTHSTSQSNTARKLTMGSVQDVTILLDGDFNTPKAQLNASVKALGGVIGRTVNAKTHCVVTNDPLSKIAQQANSLGRPVVKESWLDDLLAGKTLPDINKHTYTVAALTSPSTTTTASSGRGRSRRAASPPPAPAPASAPARPATPSPPRTAKRGRTATAASAATSSASVAAPASTTSVTATPSATTTTAKAPASKPGSKRKRSPSPAPAPASAPAPAPASTPAAASASASAPAITLKTVQMSKGSAPTDDLFPYKGFTVVNDTTDGVLDAMLNQTDIRNNNNKFYLLQVLKNGAGRYCTWFRWGRVGNNGQSSVEYDGPSKDAAKRIFLNKFNDKAATKWNNRSQCTPRPGKYTYIERDYSHDDDEDDMNGDQQKSKGGDGDESKDIVPKIPDSTLHPRVQSLISLICDVSMMNRQMIEVGYDSNKLPLGKLSKTVVKQGYNVLSQIADVLEEAKKNGRAPSSSTLQTLSSQFYTYIPHSFGMRVPPVINTPEMLKAKIEMVESLAEIESAAKIIATGKTDYTVNPLDHHYNNLKCKLAPVTDDSVLDMIKRYVANTHATTHSSYSLDVLDVFEVEREGEADRFQAAQHHQDTNRHLLWHGSRLTNYVGILSQGLRIAPPEAPATGYMFGKGVYFADMVSKSANYCFTSPSNDVGCLLLAEVALGRPNELLQANYNAHILPSGCLSTKGVGRTHPDPTGTLALPDGVKIPMGKGVDSNVAGGSLLYNEFIVYNTSQVRMRYLLKVKFDWKRGR